MLFCFVAFRCATHSAHGTLKDPKWRLKIKLWHFTTVWEILPRILKVAWKTNDCLGFLQMTPIHLISWGGTKMAHFLGACILFHKLLAPHHRDRLFSLNNRKQERDTVYSRKDIQRFVWVASFIFMINRAQHTN